MNLKIILIAAVVLLVLLKRRRAAAEGAGARLAGAMGVRPLAPPPPAPPYRPSSNFQPVPNVTAPGVTQERTGAGHF